MFNSKKVRCIFIIFFSMLFVLSSVMLIMTVTDREKAKSDFEDLAEIVSTPQEDLPTESDTTSSESHQTLTPKPTAPALTRNIPALIEMNNDCVGWIYIKGTRVNYPVMYTPTNPEKYLKKNFYGKYSGSGVPFIDSRCGLDSSNIIIYGHNMKNLTMFGDLRKYVNKSFLKNHPIIEFETLDGLNHYRIIEVRKTDIYDNWFTHNINGTQDGKKYLTLSTCTGTNKKARLLIIAEKQVETNDVQKE